MKAVIVALSALSLVGCGKIYEDPPNQQSIVIEYLFKVRDHQVILTTRARDNKTMRLLSSNNIYYLTQEDCTVLDRNNWSCKYNRMVNGDLYWGSSTPMKYRYEFEDILAKR